MNADRYLRQTTLADFGPEAQERLARSAVLVVGAGGLGTPVLQYLNAMGVGRIGIIDDDTVALSNLPRQVMYHEADVGQSKVRVATQRLRAQNGQTKLEALATRLRPDNALDIISRFDIVVDASDNFATRYLINDAGILLNRPFVYGALHGWEGHVSVLNYRGGPTYRDLFPYDEANFSIPDCNAHGVLGVLPGLIGCYQALETVKVLIGASEVLSGHLLVLDGLTLMHRKIKYGTLTNRPPITRLQTYYGPKPDSASSVEARHLDQLLRQEAAVVLDVRTHSEYEGFSLSNTRHIPLSELNQRYRELPDAPAVYVLCASGQRSKQAVALLSKLRPSTEFVNVAGGLNAYPTGKP